MKKTILLVAVLFAFLVSCSTDDEVDIVLPVDTVLPNNDSVIAAQLLIDNNLVVNKPSEINYISSIIDTVGYKLVFGKRSDKAWFSKFALAGGNPLFEYIYKGQREDKTSFIFKYEIPNEDRILFEIAIGLKDSSVPGVSVPDSLSNVLLDFNSGNVLFSEVKEALSYDVSRQQIKYYYENYFLMLEGESSWDWKSLKCFNYEGKILWERETTLYEANSERRKSRFYDIFKVYNDSIFIGGKNFFLEKLDLKNKNSIWSIELDKRNTQGTYFPEIDGFYSRTGIEFVGDTILIYYDQKKGQITDQFATEEYEPILIAKWLCKVNLYSGVKISVEVVE